MANTYPPTTASVVIWLGNLREASSNDASLLNTFYTDEVENCIIGNGGPVRANFDPFQINLFSGVVIDKLLGQLLISKIVELNPFFRSGLRIFTSLAEQGYMLLKNQHLNISWNNAIKRGLTYPLRNPIIPPITYVDIENLIGGVKKFTPVAQSAADDQGPFREDVADLILRETALCYTLAIANGFPVPKVNLSELTNKQLTPYKLVVAYRCATIYLAGASINKEGAFDLGTLERLETSLKSVQEIQRNDFYNYFF